MNSNGLNKGKFIVFEGCEGVGKSTQIAFLKEYLEENGLPHLFTREPGGTDVGEQIRKTLKDESLDMCDVTELMLFEAARRENTEKNIIPALKEGKIVVADRYIYSTLAYQAFGRGIDRRTVDTLNEIGSAGVNVDLVIFLDAPPFGNTSREASDRMEKAGTDFHKRVYEGYKELAKELDNFIAIKPFPERSQTRAEILRVLKERRIID